MPANPLSTTIAIGGKLQASLPAAVRAANLQLLQLNRSVTKVNESFLHLGRHAITGLLGLAGIGAVVEVARESVELAKEEAGVRAALSNLIMNQNKLRGVGVQQSREQVELLERQARALQHQTGIYSGVILKGDVYLSQFKLSTRQIVGMQGAMADLLTYQRQLGRSAESFPEVYEAIGKGIMGTGKGLKSVGVELNAQQQQILKINALMGDYAANARMIAREIERQHGGAAATFISTLGGQAAKATADIDTFKEGLGEVLRPLIQLSQIIVSRFITPLAGGFERLNKIVMDHWKEWVNYIDRYLVPSFTGLVNKGWNLLFKAIDYLKQTGIETLLKSISRAFDDISGSVGGSIFSFRAFSMVMQEIGQWMFGTKKIDPKNLGFSKPLTFPKGVIPKAMPVYKGFLADMIKDIQNWIDNDLGPKIEASLKPVVKEWIHSILDLIRDTVAPWADQQYAKLDSWVTQKMDALVREQLRNFNDWVLSNPTLRWLNDLLEGRAPAGPHGTGFQRIPGGTVDSRKGVPGVGRGGPIYTLGAGRFSDLTGPGGSLAVREEYDWEGKSSQYHLGKRLLTGPYVGLNPQEMAKYGLAQGDLVHTQAGWLKIQESASRRGTIEFHADYPGQFQNRWQRLTIDQVRRHGRPPVSVLSTTPSKISQTDLGTYKQMAKSAQEAAAKVGKVTINYHVTHNHNTGSGDLEHRMTAIHRQHIDQMRKDLAEATYMNNRASFDGARAI